MQVESSRDGVVGLPARLTDAVSTYIPQLFAGLLLLLAGWLVAWLLRAVVVRVATRLGLWLPRLLPGGARRFSRPGRLPALLGALTFWVVLLAFIGAASQVWGLTLFADWFDRVLAHLPVAAFAALILIGGFLLGQFVRDLVRSATTGLSYRAPLAAGAQIAIWAVTTVITLDLIGLDITFLVVLAGIVVGAVAGGAALAFGIGARGHVNDLLGVRDMRERYRQGDAIRIGPIEGRIVSLGGRVVILETEEGQVAVPGKWFGEQPCTLLIREESGG
ncbi:MAG: mechanosensitive ion channel family protein [Longimicrobiales bacterium]